MSKVQRGIIGPGNIANRFADALKTSFSGELKGIASKMMSVAEFLVINIK